jgi:hypothetical protein
MIPSQFLMEVPASLLALVRSGGAVVDGAVVKDAATNLILGHLQPTNQVTQLVLSRGLGLVADPVNLVLGGVQNVQLLKLQDMVETVKTVASIGAAASVLNLGVSVGGFAMVLASLRRVESGLDEVSRQLSRVATLQRAEFMGRCSRSLSMAEEAFSLQSPAERQRYWQEADSRLGELVETAVSLAAAQGLPLEGISNEAVSSPDRCLLLGEPEVVDTLRWLLAFSAARTELLLCLGHPGTAAQLAGRSEQWLGTLPFSARELAQSKLAGRPVPPSQIRTVTAMASSTSVLINAGRKVASERAGLCTWLQEKDVDTQEHMLYLRSAEPKVLLWADKGIAGGD